MVQIAHGQRDYADIVKQNTIITIGDLGELAVRLKSIVSYDRRGDVVWLDDFEGPVLLWKTALSGTGAESALYSEYARNGSQACKLTAGEGAEEFAEIYRYITSHKLGRIGAEFSFTVDPDTLYVQVYLDYHDGTNLHRAAARYSKTNAKWQYLNSSNNWTDFLTSKDLENVHHTFHTMKIVADMATEKFVRILTNEDSTDLSTIDLRKQLSSVLPCIQITITHVSSHASVKSIYIDDVIVTQNEP